MRKKFNIPIHLFLFYTIFLFQYSLFAKPIEKPEKYDTVVYNGVYTSYYNYNYKQSVKVRYYVYGNTVNVLNIKKRPGFKSEKKVPKPYRAYTSDYTKSGYDRGHMMPDAVCDYNETILKKCYSMVNILPQTPKLNRRTWKYLENHVRKLAVEYKMVKVTNYIYFDESDLKRIGKHKIAVPLKFIKKVEYSLRKQPNIRIQQCYEFYNDSSLPKPLEDYLLSTKECINLK